MLFSTSQFDSQLQPESELQEANYIHTFPKFHVKSQIPYLANLVS